MRGAWTAARRIVAPVASNTASNEAVKFRSAVAGQESDVPEPPVESEGEVTGLLHRPLAGGRCGDAAKVHSAGAVLDEHQDVEALQQHGVHVQEVDGEDPGGLSCQELPPGRAPAARRRIDARVMQDLPHRGRRNGETEFHQLAVNPAVSPQRVLRRQADDETGDAQDCRRAARLAPLARVVPLRGQHAVPGQQRRWCHGEDTGPAPAGEEPGQRGEPHPAGRLVPHPADVAAQHRVLVPEHQQLSILRQVSAE
jgi:hypothetical protein